MTGHLRWLEKNDYLKFDGGGSISPSDASACSLALPKREVYVGGVQNSSSNTSRYCRVATRKQGQAGAALAYSETYYDFRDVYPEELTGHLRWLEKHNYLKYDGGGSISPEDALACGIQLPDR